MEECFAENHNQQIQPVNLPPVLILNYRLGRVYEAGGKLEQSENAYSKADDISTAQNRLGWIFIKSGRYQEAEKAFRQAITLNSKNADATINLASCCLWLPNVGDEDLEEAVSFAKKALSLEGGNLWYKHYILGRLYHKQGTLNEALNHLRHAVKLNPTCPQFHYYLAELLNDLDDEAKAKQHLTEFFGLPGRDRWEKKARNLMQRLVD